MVANSKQLLFGFKNKKNLALEARDFGIWIPILLNFSNKVDFFLLHETIVQEYNSYLELVYLNILMKPVQIFILSNIRWTSTVCTQIEEEN